VIALVLAHMTPDKASMVMAGLPSHLQAETAHRIAVMDRTTPEIIRAVEANLERKLSSVLQPSELSRVGGVDPLVNIINRSDRPTERLIVEGLEGLLTSSASAGSSPSRPSTMSRSVGRSERLMMLTRGDRKSVV